ncbi:MAG TPA: cobalamin-independent methionine synthase II family protein [Candidatus Binatia bacterium]|nr:cobalamin-independent methionine synthase II family protein [Candidatus Binatia bacterium]
MITQDLHLLRIDQVGSLAGTTRLLTAFEQNAAGELSDEQLREIADEEIRALIRAQETIGFPILTDGELRRRNFQDSFAAAVSGFDVPENEKAAYEQVHKEITTRPFARAEQDFAAAGPAVYTRRPVVERLRFRRNVPLEEYTFSSQIATAPVKVTLLSPDRISQRFDYEHSRNVYADIDAFLADVVAIEREMIRALVDAGCRYIQIDAPGYTAYVDSVSLERMRGRGEDPARNLARSIAADNAVIEGFEGTTFGIHLCRGNPRTVDPATGKIVPQWHREGSYDAIAEQLFNGLKHDRLLLEYDSERAGSFEPLRFVPKDKVVVLGLVTTKSTDVEPLDALRRRIDEASRYLALDQLALSPQCGFGSSKSGALFPQEDQWRKLERIVETAAAVWG